VRSRNSDITAEPIGGLSIVSLTELLHAPPHYNGAPGQEQWVIRRRKVSEPLILGGGVSSRIGVKMRMARGSQSTPQ